MNYEVRPIATVFSSREAVVDDNWDQVTCSIELLEDVPSEALIGLEEFSHVEVICLAHQARDCPPSPWHRRPRSNEAWPDVGVFAQRNKDRPNRLLLSVVELKKVKERSIMVRGLDAIDATPVLDIKPVFSWSGPRGTLRVATWSEELAEHYF